MAAQHTRRSLFAAAPALAVLAALPLVANAKASPATEEEWESLTRSALAMDRRGDRAVAHARRLGLRPEDCTGVYREFTFERRVILVFCGFDGLPQVHVANTGLIVWGQS